MIEEPTNEPSFEGDEMSSPWFNEDQNGDPWCGFSHDEFRERLSKRNRDHVAEIKAMKAKLAATEAQRDAALAACRAVDQWFKCRSFSVQSQTEIGEVKSKIRQALSLAPPAREEPTGVH